MSRTPNSSCCPSSATTTWNDLILRCGENVDHTQRRNFSLIARYMKHKTIIGWGFCDIRNNEGRGKPVISLSLRLRLITLTETFMITDITKTEYNNCLIIRCFKGNNDKRTVEEVNQRDMLLFRCVAKCHSQPVNLTMLLEIVHCARNLQIIHYSRWFPDINCRLLANEKTDSDYNV